jgi:RimJ/RimL family protein N-acetyltransferase
MRHARGHGYATEAAPAALNDAFTGLGLAEEIAYTAADNLRSQAVMSRLQCSAIPRATSRQTTTESRLGGDWSG